MLVVPWQAKGIQPLCRPYLETSRAHFASSQDAAFEYMKGTNRDDSYSSSVCMHHLDVTGESFALAQAV